MDNYVTEEQRTKGKDNPLQYWETGQPHVKE